MGNTITKNPLNCNIQPPHLRYILKEKSDEGPFYFVLTSQSRLHNTFRRSEVGFFWSMRWTTLTASIGSYPGKVAWPGDVRNVPSAKSLLKRDLMESCYSSRFTIIPLEKNFNKVRQQISSDFWCLCV